MLFSTPLCSCVSQGFPFDIDLGYVSPKKQESHQWPGEVFVVLKEVITSIFYIFCPSMQRARSSPLPSSDNCVLIKGAQSRLSKLFWFLGCMVDRKTWNKESLKSIEYHNYWLFALQRTLVVMWPIPIDKALHFFSIVLLNTICSWVIWIKASSVPSLYWKCIKVGANMEKGRKRIRSVLLFSRNLRENPLHNKPYHNRGRISSFSLFLFLLLYYLELAKHTITAESLSVDQTPSMVDGEEDDEEENEEAPS